jgi:hypothetical protein
MTIWTNWDPLQSVIVGSCYKPGDIDSYIDKDSVLGFNKILEETCEDLDSLETFFKRRNIKTYRPTVSKPQAKLEFPNFTCYPTAPIIPRDQYFVYGKTIYQTYTSMPDRYIDSLSYTDIFSELFDNGYNWISQPPPSIRNLDPISTWWAVGSKIYNEYDNKILWHTATMFKCGDAIITNTKGPGTSRGLKWMHRNLINTRLIENVDTTHDNWGHIDHGWFMIDDETVICKDISWVPLVLRKKNIIEIKNYLDSFNFEKFTNDFKNSNGKLSSSWIDQWLKQWSGYVQKTDFDTNVLVIDSNNILFAKEQPRLFEFLQKHNINCHYVTQRHSLFWEAGIHCLTLDLERTGDLRKIC